MIMNHLNEGLDLLPEPGTSMPCPESGRLTQSTSAKREMGGVPFYDRFGRRHS